MTRQRYGIPRTDRERETLARHVGASFGVATDAALAWLAKAGLDNQRVLVEDNVVLGGMLMVPMGQYFGGRAIAMTGIAGVGIDPARRGSGAATTLMRRSIQEMRRLSVPLSALYPATAPLYRRAGYEMAGGLYRATLIAREIAGGERLLPMREASSSDEAAIRRVYARYATSRNGWLERGPYVWRRTRIKRDGSRARGYVALRDRRIEGYVFYHQDPQADGDVDMDVTDLAYATPEAARTLLAFLADQRSITEAIRFHCSPDEGLLSLMRERRQHLERRFPWMLRIVDVRAALAARGYPMGVSGRLSFEVSDDVVASNRGRFTLDVDKGVGCVKEGGRGALRLSVRALAPLFSGHHSGRRLAEMGQLQASPRIVAQVDGMFAGPAPSLADFF
jgi:predicted acetyltransferase